MLLARSLVSNEHLVEYTAGCRVATNPRSLINVSMNFGNGAVHNIYSRSRALLPSSYQPDITLGWRLDEVWRRFVVIVESGLVNMATSIAGELIASRRVCHFQVTSSSSNVFSSVEAPIMLVMTYTVALFLAAGCMDFHRTIAFLGYCVCSALVLMFFPTMIFNTKIVLVLLGLCRPLDERSIGPWC